MPRNTKKKLAILAGTSKCLLYAEAKFCASEMPGEVKYYECPRTEYCCAFGCCVPPGFHFHHLWYYWLLVIIMFLVCSGGGWWYRYWLQGRYRAAASAIPSRSSNTRSPNVARGPTCQVQQARITYNSARNTVLLHRMWKGPQRNGGSSSLYNGNATTSTHYQNMNVVLNDANCPYYQLYGPPPSYETVIAQTRGKIASPEHSATARSSGQQAGSALQNPMGPPQCYVYPCSPSARYNVGGLNQATQCQNGTAVAQPLENRHEEFVFPHFSQHCVANSGAMRQNFYCVPFEYEASSVGHNPSVYPVESVSRAVQGSPKCYARYNGTSKSSVTSDMENGAQSSETNAEARGNNNSQLNVQEDRSSLSDISDVEVIGSQRCNSEGHTSLDYPGLAEKNTKSGLLDQTISKVHGRLDFEQARGKHKDRGQHQRHLTEKPPSFRLMDFGERQRKDSCRGSENSPRTTDPQTSRCFLGRAGYRGSFNERQRMIKPSNNSIQAERHGIPDSSGCFFGSQERLLCSARDAALVETSYELCVIKPPSQVCATHRYTRMDASAARIDDGQGRSAEGEPSEPKNGCVDGGGSRSKRVTQSLRNSVRGKNVSSSYEGLSRYGAAFESALRFTTTSPSDLLAEAITSPLQSSPSNNVILPSFSSGRQASEAEDADGQQRRLSAANTSYNLESKCKLDRSKSLD